MVKNLIILRHAPAGEREDFRKISDLPDSKRPITKMGRDDLKKILKLYKKFLPPIDLIWTSPYTRALQTAEVAAKSFDCKRIHIENAMKPSAHPKLLAHKILTVAKQETILAVGHQPHLSFFLSFVLTESTNSLFDIKKSGIAWMELDKGKARLKCLLQPSQMKKALIN